MSEPVTPKDKGEECANCKFAIYQDTGYSNWTIMGTEFYCAKRLHPADGFDVFYDTDPGLMYAAQCAGFEAGGRIELDVDREVELTPEEQEIVRQWEETGTGNNRRPPFPTQGTEGPG